MTPAQSKALVETSLNAAEALLPLAGPAGVLASTLASAAAPLILDLLQSGVVTPGEQAALMARAQAVGQGTVFKAPEWQPSGTGA